ncbi:LRRC6 [Symbiodinium sp. KB8]|nr:LRRC6 [Symbiodinium sp. KB8]
MARLHAGALQAAWSAWHVLHVSGGPQAMAGDVCLEEGDVSDPPSYPCQPETLPPWRVPAGSASAGVLGGVSGLSRREAALGAAVSLLHLADGTQGDASILGVDVEGTALRYAASDSAAHASPTPAVAAASHAAWDTIAAAAQALTKVQVGVEYVQAQVRAGAAVPEPTSASAWLGPLLRPEQLCEDAAEALPGGLTSMSLLYAGVQMHEAMFRVGLAAQNTSVAPPPPAGPPPPVLGTSLLLRAAASHSAEGAPISALFLPELMPGAAWELEQEKALGPARGSVRSLRSTPSMRLAHLPTASASSMSAEGLGPPSHAKLLRMGKLLWQDLTSTVRRLLVSRQRVVGLHDSEGVDPAALVKGAHFRAHAHHVIAASTTGLVEVLESMVGVLASSVPLEEQGAFQAKRARALRRVRGFKMTRLTAELVRKKAEHHDGIIGDLEEISLHQLELEKLEVIGELCRKLRILYLQNNIIPRIENIHYLKDLRYLNMALNNVERIEGLRSCEFLEKLDLTVNFIDLDTFEESIQHLAPLSHFKELFLMGNPAMEWDSARAFIVATLPQLQRLDGQEITRTERIKAVQDLPRLTQELRAAVPAAKARRAEKEAKAVAAAAAGEESAPWTPASRVELYREVQEQKEEEARRKAELEPRKRDAEKEHREKLAATRAAEGKGSAGPGDSEPSVPAAQGGASSVRPALPRMANEGRLDFKLEDEDGQGNSVLTLPLPRFLDSSLVDVDVHPLYVSVVVKNKLFRLHWPEEVRPDAGSARRSTTTGALVITVPKVSPKEGYMALVRRDKAAAKAAAKAKRASARGAISGTQAGVSGGPPVRGGGGTVMDFAMAAASSARKSGGKGRKGSKKSKTQGADKGSKSSKTVSLAGLVPGAPVVDAGVGQLLMTATASRPLAEAEAHSAASEPTPAMPGSDAKPPAPQLIDEAGGALEVKPSPAVSALD